MGVAYRVDFTEAAAPGTSQWFDASGFHVHEGWVTFVNDQGVVGGCPAVVVRAVVKEAD